MKLSLTLAMAALTAVRLQAGTPAPATPPPPPPNPLSFMGGALIFDIEEKMRFESRENNFDFNSAINGPQDASWLLQRFRFGALYSPTPWLKFYLQGQDIREIGGSRPNELGAFAAEGDNVFDIHEAWAQIGSPLKDWSFKLGRQKLAYGDQRLVGPLEWLNSARVFDAAKLRYASESLSVDVFTSSVVNQQDHVFDQSDFIDDDDNRDQIFSGIYLSSKILPFQTTDFYVYHLSQNSPAGNTNFATIGTFWKGDPKKLGGWDYEVEMAMQFGDAVRLGIGPGIPAVSQDLAAFAGHWELGYNYAHPWKPRVAVQYNYGSGDDNPTDGTLNTFQNLFPTNHLFYGFVDTTGWINMHNPQLNLSVQPTEKLKIGLDYHAYWSATNNDAWFRVNGVAQVRPVNGAARAASNFRGQEVDLTVAYKVNKRLGLLFGYSVFFAGDYLADTGASDNAHFGYVQAQLNF